MTDEELLRRIKLALLVAAEQDFAQELADTTPVQTSPRYQRRMEAMLKDPNGYVRRYQARRALRRAARMAASFLLVCAVSFSLALAVSPGIRAEVLRWVREVNEDHVFYRFSGEDLEADGLRYTLVKLPDGYVKTEERTEERGFFQVIYRNAQGQEIVLSCADPAQGVVLEPDLSDKGEGEEMKLHKGTGLLYHARTTHGSSALVWLEEDLQVQFMIEAPVDEETLADMAIWVFPEMPRYHLTELPQGVAPYDEMPISEGPNSVHLTYVDEEGYFFSLSWVYMQQGSGVGVSGGTGEGLHTKEVTVHGLPGQYYWSDDPEDSPGVVWIDEEKNLLFTMSGRFSEEDLLRLAEGLVPAE